MHLLCKDTLVHLSSPMQRMWQGTIPYLSGLCLSFCTKDINMFLQVIKKIMFDGKEMTISFVKIMWWLVWNFVLLSSILQIRISWVANVVIHVDFFLVFFCCNVFNQLCTSISFVSAVCLQLDCECRMVPSSTRSVQIMQVRKGMLWISECSKCTFTCRSIFGFWYCNLSDCLKWGCVDTLY